MLDENIIRLLEEIAEVTIRIKELYTILEDLELSKVNTQEYNKVLDSLKNNIELENKLYDLIPNEYQLLEKIIAYLFPSIANLLNISTSRIKNCVIVNDSDNLVKGRIYEKLFAKIISTNDISMYSIIVETPNKLEISYASFIKIILAIENDFAKSVLTILNLYINSKDVINKEDLLNIKYNYSFIMLDVENDLLNNNFNLPTKIEWELPNLSKSLNIPMYVVDGLRTSQLHEIFGGEIIKEINRKISNKDDDIIAILFTRAALLYFGSEAEVIKKTIQVVGIPQEISLKEQEKLQRQTIIAKEVVDKIFAYLEQDKNLVEGKSLDLK